jgi:hypothetical protein
VAPAALGTSGGAGATSTKTAGKSPQKPANQAPAKQKPEPAVAGLSMTMNSVLPLASGPFVTNGNELPLLVPLNTTAGSLDLTTDKPLGYVGRAGGVAPVFWSGELRDIAGDKGRAAVLEVRNLSGVGEYKGSIDLVPGVEGGEVEITVGVTDAIYWAALVLLVGIVIAFALKRLIGVKRVQSELGESLAEINATFARARRDFSTETAGQPYGAYDLLPVFDAASEEAKAKIDALSRNFGVGIDSAAHDEANAALGSMREAADSWQPFGESLAGLALHLGELNSDLPGEGGDDIWPAGRPQILAEPPKLLNGHAFASFDEYSECRGKVADAGELLSYWDSLRRQLAEYRELQRRLLEGNHPTADREALEGLEPSMQEIANELWRVTSEAELAERESKEDLLRIEKVLSRFPIPPASPGKPDVLSTARVLVARTGLTVASSGGPVAGTERTEFQWAEMAKKLRQRRFALDLLIAAGALGIALFAGLNALYFGKEFGTPADYLNALLWGGTTEGAMAGLIAALGRVGPVGSALATPATLPQLAGEPYRH